LAGDTYKRPSGNFGGKCQRETFGVTQGTFGVIQGTFGMIQGTFGVIQGTLCGSRGLEISVTQRKLEAEYSFKWTDEGTLAVCRRRLRGASLSKHAPAYAVGGFDVEWAVSEREKNARLEVAFQNGLRLTVDFSRES
jgi:hypothetical protein